MRPPPCGGREPPPHEPATLRTLLAGVHFVWHHKLVLGAISLGLFAVPCGGAMALLPMLACDILHVGPWGPGLLRSAPAVGALVMSGVLTRWPVRRHTGPLLLATVAVYRTATLVVAGLWPWLISALAQRDELVQAGTAKPSSRAQA